MSDDKIVINNLDSADGHFSDMKIDPDNHSGCVEKDNLKNRLSYEKHLMTTFNNQSVDILDSDQYGELFLLDDILEAVEYPKNTNGNYNIWNAIKLIDEDLRYKFSVYSSKANRNYDKWYLTEFGVYNFLGRTQAPKAKEFQRWTYKVLQEIRKTGSYSMVPQEHQLKELAIAVNGIISSVNTLSETIGSVVKIVDTFNNRLAYLEASNLKLLNIVESFQLEAIKDKSKLEFKDRVHNEKVAELNKEIDKIVIHGYSTVYNYIKSLGKTQKDFKKGFSLQNIGAEIEKYMQTVGEKAKYAEKGYTKMFPIYLIDLYFTARQPLN